MYVIYEEYIDHVHIDFSLRRSTPICYTDGNGPEVFRRCADQWAGPDDLEKDNYGQYENKYNRINGCATNDPPSSLNEVCKHFHERIEELR